MSLLGSLLKKANTAPKAVPVAPAIPSLISPKNDSLKTTEPMLEKLQIGSKRKNAFNFAKEDSDGSNGAFDCNGKMTKLVPNPAQAAYMGPNLWDEVLTFGDCSTLECLNTEDFLFETGILLEDPKKNGAPTKIDTEPKVERPKAAAVHRQPVSISSSASTSPSSTVSGVSTDASVLRNMLVDDSVEVKNNALDTDILQKLLQGCSIPHNVTGGSCETAEEDGEEEEEDTDQSEFPARTSPPLPVIAAEINMSDRELHLATVPGEDVFNPKARRFEHEELRPLPVMRKAKKQFVPEEQKDDKYWERRRKNNVAAKRARDAQRIKMNQIMVRTAWLEKENDKLTAKLAESLAERERLEERLAMYEKVE